MAMWASMVAAWLGAGGAMAQSFPAQLVVAGDAPIMFRAGSEVLLGRGYLGVEMIDVNPGLRRYFGAPDDVGVLVARVSPDSPASRAGLRIGDVVVSVDGEPVVSAWDLIRAVRPRVEGDQMSFDVVRDRKLQKVQVLVAERDRQPMVVPGTSWGMEELEQERRETIEDALSQAFGTYADPSMALEMEPAGPDVSAILGRMKELEARILELEAALRGAE